MEYQDGSATKARSDELVQQVSVGSDADVESGAGSDSDVELGSDAVLDSGVESDSRAASDSRVEPA